MHQKSHQVSLRLPDGDPIRIDSNIESDALRQAYIVRNRQRWDSNGPPDYPKFLNRLGVGDKELKRIAEAGVVEVSVPWSDVDRESWGWAARIMPWEFILSRATSQFRDERPFTVIRRLETGSAGSTEADLLRNCLFVESAPKELANAYDLTSETRLMRASLGVDGPRGVSGQQVRVLAQPDLERLKATIRKTKPSLIHYAGLDIRQAAALLEAEKDIPRAAAGMPRDFSMSDGLALRVRNGESPFALAGMIANALFDPDSPAELVSVNTYNSAPLIAPLLIAAGARHVIGFQDTIDDRIAENFFVHFYRALALKRDLPLAFQSSVRLLLEEPGRLLGACIVLWSAPSLIDRFSRAAKADVPAVRLRLSAPVTIAPDEPLPEASNVSAEQRVEVFCKPHSEINYALLHNGRTPFERLQIMRRMVSGRIPDIDVDVEMHVGDERFRFRKSLELAERQVMADLTDQVVIPLTSSLMRIQSEKIRSALAVEVRVANRVVHRDTYRMTLAPVDQWSDTNEDRLWLPSFVLPRDPEVASVVQSARNYIITRRDDPTAGFEGYQSKQPTAVDAQVCALWYALLLDRPLVYINPPPAYPDPNRYDFPQRLRTPTEILKGGHGTCIDLALLLCACLEYVEIYPVIFLLDDHAFPGYWRSEKAHEEFVHFANFAAVDPDQPGFVSTSERVEASYTVPKAAYDEIKSMVDSRDLVPLETTSLTANCSFKQAKDKGIERLRERRKFQSMLDLYRARGEGVAPLPILWRPM